MVEPGTSLGASHALAGRLRERVSGTVLVDEPLAAHTTIKVGGPAAALVRAETAADLAGVAGVCAELDAPYLILGRGSNVLVADKGWTGVVVTLGRGFRGVEVHGSSVVAGGGEPMPTLAATVADRGLAGLVFGVAIPGTLGGAVRMNAGAHGGELADVLAWADIARLAAGARIERVVAADLGLRYRRSDLPEDAVVVRAGLELRRADPETMRQEMVEMKAWRRAHQPINSPSCGSVFVNPPGSSAGRLIEASGMKGFRIGGAQVSQVHANFITVRPGATAADVRAVLEAVRAAVAERQGVALHTEVQLIGFGTGDDPTAGGVKPW